MKKTLGILTKALPFFVVFTAGYLLIHAGLALAEAPVAEITPAVAGAATDAASGFLDKLTALLMSWQGASASIAILLEFVFRLLPTQSPLSWAWVVSNVLHAGSKLFEAAAELMDKILPQKLK